MDTRKKAADPERLLRAKAKTEKPLMQIGKNGITEECVSQVDALLKRKKLLKIRLLKSFVEAHDRKEAAKELAERTNSRLIEQIGFVVTLYRK